MSALLDNNTSNLTDSQQDAVKQLKEIIINDYPLINIQQDVHFLTKYLYVADWNVQDAITKIIHFYHLKKHYPTWFACKKVSDYFSIINTNSRYMLLDRDRNGRRIFVYKLDKFNSPGMNFKISSQLDDMWYEAMLMDQHTQYNGLSVIIDCKNIPKSMVKWLNPKDLKISSEKTNTFPCKNLDIHLVNVSTLLNIISKAVSPFLNENIKSKFHFHQNDWTLLHEFVGKDCLPEEYGGPPGKTVELDRSYKFLLDKESILLENMKYGVN